MSQVIRFFRCILPVVALSVAPLANISAQARPGSIMFTQINVPGSASTELDNINNQGEIVGYFVDQSGKQHGVAVQNGIFTQLDFPGATATRTVGNNSLGDMVGFFIDSSGAKHGLLREAGRFTQLDFPGLRPRRRSASTMSARLSEASPMPPGIPMPSWKAWGLLRNSTFPEARTPSPTASTISVRL